ncbi:TolA protein [Aphelenchoides besseyi]|nr:TolA protein [Aphelenchoides besseyi]
MSTKKLSPEEELEKQYSDYKAQFEQWKEKNKGSEHTEGYINYVKQFKEWEKSVETRRIAVRNKSQQERQRQEAAQNEQRQRQDETAAAARYAKQQEQYMSVHVRALEEQERIRKQKVSTTQSINSVQPSEQQAIHHTPPVQQSQPLIQPQRALGIMETNDLKQINFGLPYSGFEFGEDDAIKRGPHIQADPQPLQSQQNMILPDAESKILLWGEDGFDYLPNDPMNVKWGQRANPPNLRDAYCPAKNNRPIIPSWYLSQKFDQCNFVGNSVTLNSVQVVKLPTAETSSVPPPIDFSVPPPNILPASQ